MNPFCCVSPLPDHKPPPALSSRLPMSSSAAARSDPAVRLGNHFQNHGQNHGHARVSSCGDQNRLSQRSTADAGVTRMPSAREQPAVDVKINDIVGNGISGMLYKWVNYGKGWRPRWFVLQDGVLSYYKIHGPDKIVVNQETERGSKVIGEESMRRVSRTSRGQPQLRRKPFGEIHLKVSSIRESKSDDKRFSIFTGTKRLHLRAETREDRLTWMEALQAVKDMFPRMSNSELMAPLDNVAVSTEKLRQRLQEEGLCEAAIVDSEQIMRSEFASLQSQLLLLRQKQSLLTDTLRQLEVRLCKDEATYNLLLWFFSLSNVLEICFFILKILLDELLWQGTLLHALLQFWSFACSALT